MNHEHVYLEKYLGAAVPFALSHHHSPVSAMLILLGDHLMVCFYAKLATCMDTTHQAVLVC